jgi:hypothetical protein
VIVGATSFSLLRRVPAPGEIGSVTGCPLCQGGSVPCLACRDELRARLAELSLASHVEAALN